MSWISGWWKGEKKEEDNNELPNYGAYLNNYIWTDTNYNQGFINNAFGPFDAGPVLPIIKGGVHGTLLCVATLKSWDSAQYISDIIMTFTRIRISNGSTLVVQELKNYGGMYLRQFKSESYSSTVKEAGVLRKINVTLKCDNLFYGGDTFESANIFDNENQKIIMTGLITEDEYSFTNEDKVTIDKTFIIGKFKSGMQTDLVVSGEIPVWFYDKFLPLSTNGYVGSNGDKADSTTGFHIGAVNDSFYQTIYSSINFGRRKDINLDYFDRFYVKNVTISIYYKSEIERRNVFKYWTNKKEQTSTITYLTDPEADDIYDIKETKSNTGGYVLIVCFNPKNGNDFLDKYVVEDGRNKILEFDVRTVPALDEKVKDLKNYNSLYTDGMIIVDQMILKKNGNEFEIRCCSKEVSGANVICSSGTASCEVIPDYKITNLCCINTNNLDLKSELPEASITLSKISQYTVFTYDNLYLTNLTKVGATNTNLLLEGDITSLYQYLPFKRTEYPEGYPEILKSVNTINDSPVPNEYLDANISMCLINIEDANDINISKFGTTKDGEFVQNVFVSLIIAYRDNDIIQKLTNSGLKSRNQAVSHGVTLGDGEVEYADTRYRFGNPNLVQSITNSDETNYDAIQLYFANQYNNKFLNDEITNVGNDWNLIIDLNNKPTDPNDPESPSTSDQFRSMMDSNDSLLLFVKRLETIGNISFWNGKSVTNVQIYYYDANGEYVSEPKTFTKFKTKIDDAYFAVTYKGEDNKTYLTPVNNYFNSGNRLIKVPDSLYFIGISIINKLYMTGKKISYNNQYIVIRSQKINLFVNGVIPAWVFKKVLPLEVKVKENNVTKTYYKFINMETNQIYSAESGATDDLQIIGINDKPNIQNVLFPTVNDYIGSSIDLSDISDGTAVANKDVFDRMSIGSNKVFFVNKVTLLRRFEGKIDVESDDALFQYYEGEPTQPKNCDPSKGEITYADDWALKLPKCYEGCKIDKDDATQLVMKFGTYEQLNSETYLLSDVFSDLTMYLDVSMSEIDGSNIAKVKLYLKKLKYFNSWDDDSYKIDFYYKLQKINVLFNKNGFIETKQLSFNILTEIIDKCYVIGGTNRLENSIRLIKPLKNAFMIYNNKECIAFPYSNFVGNLLTINKLECTNTQNSESKSIKSVNLLVSGEIPTWIMEYMPLPINLKFLEDDLTYGCIYEFTNEDSYDLQITSVNALPTPDGDVGIDNVN